MTRAVHFKEQYYTTRRALFMALEGGHTEHFPSRLFDYAMTVLILANLTCIALESVPSIAAAYGDYLVAFDMVSVAIFTTEYVLRLWVAMEHPLVRAQGPLLGRLRFAVTPMMLIDFIAIAPAYFAAAFQVDTRALRLFRIARFLRLARTSPALATLGLVIVNERRALAGTVLMILGLSFMSATAMHLAEGHVQPEKFGTIPDAMWWAITTLTTVGYGDAYPVTALGRMIGAATMVMGLGMFALPIGILSTGYLEEIRRRDFVVTWAMVARVPLFSRLDAVSISEIMRILNAKVVRRGEVITHMGETATAMYFVSSGEVELRLPEGSAVLTDGDFFGEMSLMRTVRRVGTARALSRADLLVLEAHDFEALLARRPELRIRILETARGLIASGILPSGDIVPEETHHHPKPSGSPKE